MPRRFRQTLKQSLFGDFIYAEIIPPDHFLVQLDKVIDWDRFTPLLLAAYKGDAMYGAPPYAPVMILKMLLLSYLYDISERRTEELVAFTLPAKAFVGLGVTDRAPDHSTLTVFRERLIQRGKLKVFEEMLEEIVQMALRSGIQFSSIQIVDSVHSVADVNTDKDHKRQKKGKGPRDPDARWGVKHTRKVKTEDGKEEEQKEYFFGYKAHVSLNAKNGLITSLEVTSGEAYDGHHFCPLVDHDLEQKLPVDTYAGDRGYDDGDNHYYLELRGLHSAIRIRKFRIDKKDNNKQVWLDLIKTPQYQQGLKERYKIERKFGEAKQGHGFGRCRYIGTARFAVQAFFTAIMLNLKRMVKLLTGVGFKTQCVNAA